MPIRRKGMDRIQTIGNNTSAAMATGQQSTKRMHHPTNRMSAFMNCYILALLEPASTSRIGFSGDVEPLEQGAQKHESQAAFDREDDSGRDGDHQQGRDQAKKVSHEHEDQHVNHHGGNKRQEKNDE